MAGHELYALGGHLVCNGNGLLWIAGIVADFQNQLFAIDAASGIDVGYSQFSAALVLLAKRCQ